MTRKEIEQQLIDRCWQDSNFKHELINDSSLALKKAGVNLPDSIELHVLEESADVFYLIIPSQPIISEEMSENELESVAGGWGRPGPYGWIPDYQ